MKLFLLGAEWCPFTKEAKKFLEEIKGELGFELEYIDIESKEGISLSKEKGINSVPVILLDREVVFSKGVPSRKDILKIIGR